MKLRHVVVAAVLCACLFAARSWWWLLGAVAFYGLAALWEDFIGDPVLNQAMKTGMDAGIQAEIDKQHIDRLLRDSINWQIRPRRADEGEEWKRR